MKTKGRVMTAGVMVATLGLVACAEPPTAEIEAARATVTAAAQAEAEEYAPEALQRARAAQDELAAELAVQQDKMAFLRSYDKTTQLVAALKSAGEAAESQAGTAKEQARQEAASLIERLKADVVEVNQLLADAPKGKGSEADLEAMKAEAAAIEASIPEIEQEFADGRYRSVAERVQLGLQGTGRLRGDVLMAAEAVRLAKSGRKG